MATKNIYYTLGSRCVNSILASMRMHSSQLNNHLYRNNITQNKFCTCGIEETIFHFFFECTHYVSSRDILLNETLSFLNLTMKKVLHGDESLNNYENIRLHAAVSKYIVSTGRFNIF